MFDSMFSFWIGLGVLLMIGEIILPGLVSVFLGLGAVTVAGLMHYGYIDNVAMQLITWFISSTIYIFSLRLLVVHYYPSDNEKKNIDEDQAMMGKIVEVVEAVSAQQSGRISYGESTWGAISKSQDSFNIGEQVKIVGRENISWVIEKNTVDEETK